MFQADRHVVRRLIWYVIDVSLSTPLKAWNNAGRKKANPI